MHFLFNINFVILSNIKKGEIICALEWEICIVKGGGREWYKLPWITKYWFSSFLSSISGPICLFHPIILYSIL